MTNNPPPDFYSGTTRMTAQELADYLAADDELNRWDQAVVQLPDGRLGGWDIEATCDDPECAEPIFRHLTYICGFTPGSGHGCDQYFCDDHLHVTRDGFILLNQQCLTCHATTADN